MKKKIVAFGLAIALGAGSVLGYAGTETASAQNFDKQIKEYQSKQSDVGKEQQKTEAEIQKVQEEQKKVEAEIQRLDAAVEETLGKIRTKEKEIAQTQKEIEQLKVEIKALEKRIAERDELLKTRVRSVQENGGTISYMDVLLGAQSFGDFIDRISAVTTIVQQDKDILQQHQDDKDALEQKKAEVEQKLADLEKKMEELKGLKAELEGQVAKKNQLMKELKQEEEHLEDLAMDQQEEMENLKAQEATVRQMKKEYEAEQARIAREKAEAAARAAAAKKAKQSSSSTPSHTSAPAPKPATSSGAFTTPAAGPITSNYGQRWSKLHAGIDIGKRGTSVPIVAAASGTVFRSYYSSSYGNVVYITHYIKGQLYTTLYAHMENRMVSTGQKVSKGQMLGYMGNTGRSYGAHLHFELHKGPWTADKRYAVDPRPYIPGW